MAYPYSNALSISDRAGFEYHVVFSTSEERVNFERMAWVNWRLLTLAPSEKYFQKENFKLTTDLPRVLEKRATSMYGQPSRKT